MQDPFDANARSLYRKLQNARRRALLTILAERASEHGWRTFILVAFFAGIWLFQIQDMFGQIGAGLVLAVFFGGLGYFFFKDLRLLSYPGEAELDRRIEEDSLLEHRPITALKDTLSNAYKMESRELWQLSKHRAMELLVKIKPVLARSVVPMRDPYALRFAVLLFFGIGAFTAGADWKPRLAHGLVPFVFTSADGSKSGVRLIVTPPEYTGLAQMILEGKEDGELQIPVGSMLKATVHGGLGTPYLKIDGVGIPFDKASKGNYILELTVPNGANIKITQLMLPRASWTYKVTPDTAPTLVAREEATQLPEGSVRVPLTVEDDYGVKNLKMHVDLEKGAKQPQIGKAIDVVRSVLSSPKTPLDIKSTYDLTSHPWAGLPVVFTFVAEDELGQKSQPVEVHTILPERMFTHETAKQIIALRKKLILEPLESYPEIENALEDIQTMPNKWRRDNLVLLALRAASSRLYWAGPSIETAEGVAALLWDTALRIEDGNLSIAARNLRDAQMALENALSDPNTSAEELSMLMQNLRMAMAQYFMELQREMEKRIAEGKQIPFIPAEMLANTIDPETLAGMLQQMESQMMSGDRKSAQQLLSQLQNMMDMMSPSMAPLPPEVQKMIEAAKDLQEIIMHQQALLDQTSAQANVQTKADSIVRDFGVLLPENEDLIKGWGVDSMPPAPRKGPQNDAQSVIDTRENQKEQETVRYKLGQLMSKMGEIAKEIPENYGKAEQKMRDSSAELGDNRPAFSIPHQQEAIKLLKEAQKQMQQQMAQMIKKLTGMAFGGGSGLKYDPLGRPYGQGDNDGQSHGSNVKIPDEAEKKRAQEILRLIQKRAGEFDRPEGELEYYRRLLRQF